MTEAKTYGRRLAVAALAAAALLGGGLSISRTHAAPAALTSGHGHPAFSHPTAITNLFLPLAHLHQDVLTGNDGGKSARVERTARPGTRVFRVKGQAVTAMIVEDRDFTNGTLTEATRDYFAQADDGTVYYMGESVDEYRHGKVVGHGGAWLTGEHGAQPGILMTAHPKVGDTWQSEAVPGIAEERDEVLSVDGTVTVPAGTYHHCVKVKETAGGEGAEYKYYAPHVGVVQEVPEGGLMRLTTHR